MSGLPQNEFFRNLLGEPQELLKLLAIKPHHRLAVDERHRSGPEPQLHEFLESSLIRPDVLDDKRYAVLRKKLFLPVAGPSPRLRVHRHLFRHSVPLFRQRTRRATPGGTIRDCIGSVNELPTRNTPLVKTERRGAGPYSLV